jgi:hypothetical protein
MAVFWNVIYFVEMGRKYVAIQYVKTPTLLCGLCCACFTTPAGVYRQRPAPSTGPIWAGPSRRRWQTPVSETSFLIKENMRYLRIFFNKIHMDCEFRDIMILEFPFRIFIYNSGSMCDLWKSLRVVGCVNFFCLLLKGYFVSWLILSWKFFNWWKK